VCALPADGAAICGACLARPPPFAATVAAFSYAFPVDRLLRELKYGGRLANAEWLASHLARAVAAAHRLRDPRQLPDRVIALPLAASRQRERGFNQAREIAACVARELQLPLADPLDRIAAGVPQAALRWSARAQNVRGAFAARPLPRGACVALVDDVMTTGATLAAAAKALRDAGAASVECWVVARTPLPGAA
jgi:ComF family protein